jgi:hypothetical protein
MSRQARLLLQQKIRFLYTTKHLELEDFLRKKGVTQIKPRPTVSNTFDSAHFSFSEVKKGAEKKAIS